MYQKSHLAAVSAAFFIFTTSMGNVEAANIENYPSLHETVSRNGFVNILVSLDVDNSMKTLSKEKEREINSYDGEISKILGEIRGQYLEKTLWKSRFGQFSIFVTAEGLRKIQHAPGVRSIAETGATGFINDPENQISAIDTELAQNGVAEVRILPMKDPSSWIIGKGGQAKFMSNNMLKSANVSGEFLSTLSPEGLVSKQENSKNTSPDAYDPTITLRINRQGFYELISRNDIRSIELIGGSHAKATNAVEWDPEVLSIARSEGKVSISIDLKRPTGYTPLLEELSKEARESQVKSIEDAFKEIITAAEPDALSTLQSIEGIASAVVTFSYDGITRLYGNFDPRIQRVKFNRPIVKTSLATSTSGYGGGTNAQYIRTFGARGSGQWLAILDIGVQKSHPVLAGKYVAEACFGTNGNGYQTMCPQPNASGDSAYLLENSSIPCATFSNFSERQKCSHGTKMAHIAGGRATSTNVGNFDGMAPDADFFFVNIYSKPTNNNLDAISAFDYDIAAGLNFVNQLRNDFPGITVNLSSAGGGFAATCPGVSPIVHDAISRLYSRNVAVVAATGNGGLRTGIGFPACVANVVKVAGTSASSGQIWNNSNFYYPNRYVGQFFLAPANVRSAIPNDAYGLDEGTSISAAHISGAFALIKSVAPNASILEIVNLIKASHSVSASVPLPTFGGSGEADWRRLHFN